MPVVTCPKCPTKLKIPDGVSGNTKCPKCGTIFPVQAPPAFEVVEDAPAPAPKKPAPKPAAKAQALEPDFEVVDEKPKKRVVAEDDEDDEPPRKKRKPAYDDDDDDDDEPRSKKKSRAAKSKKKKRTRYDDDDDDDEDWQPRRGGGGGAFAKGKTGALLLGISFWLNLGAFGLLTLYSLIALIMANAASSSSPSSSRGSSGGSGDGSFLDVLVILPGLLGLGAWIVGTIGSSFAIAGPQKARGMAITATVFAGLHLILTGVTFSNMQDGLGGVAGAVPGLGKVAWIVMASTLPALDTFLPILFYQSKAIDGDYVIALLAAICEALRLVFMLLTLKALAAAARDHEVAERAQMDVTVAALILGAVALGSLFVAILLSEGGFKSISTYMNLGLGTIFLMYLAYSFMMLLPALVALDTKNACARRS